MIVKISKRFKVAEVPDLFASGTFIDEWGITNHRLSHSAPIRLHTDADGQPRILLQGAYDLDELTAILDQVRPFLRKKKKIVLQKPASGGEVVGTLVLGKKRVRMLPPPEEESSVGLGAQRIDTTADVEGAAHSVSPQWAGELRRRQQAVADKRSRAGSRLRRRVY